MSSTFTARADFGLRTEWRAAGSAVTIGSVLPLEAAAWLYSDVAHRIETTSLAVGGEGGAAEWERVLPSDSQFWLELEQILAGNTGLQGEIISVATRDTPHFLESLSLGSRVSYDESLCLEWDDPPVLLVVSRDRLLRSPGRIRILAGPASTHPLRTA
jgi:hypothetical protein